VSTIVLQRLFEQGVAAARAQECLAEHLPTTPFGGQTALLAIGKASADMARVALDHMHVDQGLIVTRYGHIPRGWVPPAHVELIEASHPVPDNASQIAGIKAMAMTKGLGPGDRLIALISGGGSSLLTMAKNGISLEAKKKITQAMMSAGVPISDMNCVRQALSNIKGGKLAQAAYPAPVLTYIISDVPGDDPSLVASGPTIVPRTHQESAIAILTRYDIAIPVALRLAMECDVPNSPTHSDNRVKICATSSTALNGAAKGAFEAGYEPVLLGADLNDDALILARQHGKLALNYRAQGKKVALISGGEALVKVSADRGRGGRCSTYALELAITLNGAAGICAVSGDTDGIDGSSDAAGAIIDADTLARGRAMGLDPFVFQRENRTHDFFAAVGGLLKTGPTLTNVNDLRIILVEPVS
jgi:glycerate 2-kinase